MGSIGGIYAYVSDMKLRPGPTLAFAYVAYTTTSKLSPTIGSRGRKEDPLDCRARMAVKFDVEPGVADINDYEDAYVDCSVSI